jgi:hypothetical protein
MANNKQKTFSFTKPRIALGIAFVSVVLTVNYLAIIRAINSDVSLGIFLLSFAIVTALWVLINRNEKKKSNEKVQHFPA